MTDVTIPVTAAEMTAIVMGVDFNEPVEFEWCIDGARLNPKRSCPRALVILADLRGVPVSDGDRAHAAASLRAQAGDQSAPTAEGDHVDNGGQTTPDADVSPSRLGDGPTGTGGER